VQLLVAPIPPGLPAAFADAGQVEQAVLNLVLNARDAMPEGGQVIVGLAHCRIAAADATATLREGEYVAVSVADTGVGMTEEVLSRAFEPFFTTKGTARGSGLGLSQVLGFARQSGGDVRVHTAPGRGTRVEMLLPRAEAAPAQAAAASAA
jgi:signal transduction histidine kinase